MIRLDPLSQIMGVEEAAKLWGTTPGYVKNLCAEGKVRAVKIGKTWILDKNQPNPLKQAAKD
ncbi:helix-turn-helix domain-containing protein [Collibacillus ludicampi]|uniref:helix-turn-helix domain-containing protein n=1 Tax=Collibacillus ludicampi TaxID=2771369 RepID=UPI0024949C92|nr:helix-turn-helix domain-containing protein [Collibacillus ludicampi]